MADHNVFWNVYIFKTGTGKTGIVRADNISEAAERVADMTSECVIFVVRAANVEDLDHGVVIMFDNLLNTIR